MTDPSPTTRITTPDPGTEPPAPDAGPVDVAPAPAAPAATATGWTNPSAPTSSTWQRSRVRESGRTASVIFGVILLAIGLWFFLDQTLGFELPRIRWSQLWPVFIIGLGAWIVLSTMRRGSR